MYDGRKRRGEGTRNSEDEVERNEGYMKVNDEEGRVKGGWRRSRREGVKEEEKEKAKNEE